MRYSQSLVAKQYATAYIAEFFDTLHMRDIDAMKMAVSFCRKYSTFMSLVSVLTVKEATHHSIMDEMVEHFSLPESLKKLIDLMTRHKRLSLFAAVLRDICCLYFDKNNMLEVTITTATDLDPSQQAKLENFFMKLSGKKIISNVVIDEELIAGLRMQSDLFLWQYSIASRIRALSAKVDIAYKAS